jgi:PBP1b-binding outer membrane lipoprotein LpoB
MKNSTVLTALLSFTLLLAGCSQNNDEGKVVAAAEQKKIEAAIPQNIQNANIPPQAKAAAMHGQEMGRKMGQAMNQNAGR